MPHVVNLGSGWSTRTTPVIPYGSRRDRHAAIGAGFIGLEPFRDLVRHPLLAGVPFVAETPKAGQAGDVALLKQLR